MSIWGFVWFFLYGRVPTCFSNLTMRLMHCVGPSAGLFFCRGLLIHNTQYGEGLIASSLFLYFQEIIVGCTLVGALFIKWGESLFCGIFKK